MSAATVKVRINDIHVEGKHDKTKPIDGPRSFPPINLNNVIVLYSDALVLTFCINGFDVHTVLINPSNAADLLQLPAFKQMKLSLGVVNLIERILSGFNSATTVTLGDVTLLKKSNQ